MATVQLINVIGQCIFGRPC